MWSFAFPSIGAATYKCPHGLSRSRGLRPAALGPSWPQGGVKLLDIAQRPVGWECCLMNGGSRTQVACGRDEQSTAAEAGMDHTPTIHAGTQRSCRIPEGRQRLDKGPRRRQQALELTGDDRASAYTSPERRRPGRRRQAVCVG